MEFDDYGGELGHMACFPGCQKGQCWWGGGGARYRWYGSRFLIQIHSKTDMSEYQRIDLLAVCQRERNELQLDNWIWAWRQPVAPKIAKKRPVDPLAPYVAPSGWSHHKVRSIAGLVERWAPIEPPTGLSISPKGHHLYSGHRDFSDRRFTPSNSWLCSPFKRYHNYLSVVCGYLFHLAVVPRYKASWENATLKMEVPGLCFFPVGLVGILFIHVYPCLWNAAEFRIFPFIFLQAWWNKSLIATGWFWALFVYGSFTQEQTT